MTQTVTKVFCMLSGGVDSSTTLAIAAEQYPDAPIECVTVNYGQRHRKEMEAAAYQAEVYGADHTILNVEGILQGMLVDKGINNEVIPDVDYKDLPDGISPTYVTFRNGFMLALLTARAQGWVMQMEALNEQHAVIEGSAEPTEYNAVIFCGVHRDDGVNWAYPDCSPEFIGAMANAIHVGTYFKVRLEAPLQYMDKQQVVARGLALGVDFQNTWSCYKGEEKHCGTCPTCRSRREAFEYHDAKDADVLYVNDHKTYDEEGHPNV